MFQKRPEIYIIKNHFYGKTCKWNTLKSFISMSSLKLNDTKSTYDIKDNEDISHTLQVLSPDADNTLVPSGLQDTWNIIVGKKLYFYINRNRQIQKIFFPITKEF